MTSIVRSLTIAAVALTVCLYGGSAACATSLQVTALGGWKNIGVYGAHKSGDQYEYSEDVVVYFNKVLSFPTFRYSINPSAASSAQNIGDARVNGNGAVIRVRKIPGTTYTITIPVGVKATDGTTLTAPYVFRISVPPALNVPSPIKSTKGQPYRYGILAAGSLSLGPPSDAQNVVWFANAGVRFVRIDYDGQDIEPTKGTFNFTGQDAVMDELAAQGITELPIVEQYGAPAWARGSSHYMGVWDNPQDYAAFAKAVAQHVAKKYPQITRLNLMNEANLFWDNSNSRYAARDGKAVGIYMSAAYSAIKSVAPKMTVVGPTLVVAGTDMGTFLTNMYGVGCRRSNCWDVLAINNYVWYNPTFSSTQGGRWNIYKSLQQVAANHGNPGAHIMLTEAAFSTQYSNPNAFDPRVQAYYLGLAFNLMLGDPTVDGIVWTKMYSPIDNDFWARTSLTDYRGNLLPAYAAYQKFARY